MANEFQKLTLGNFLSIMIFIKPLIAKFSEMISTPKKCVQKFRTNFKI